MADPVKKIDTVAQVEATVAKGRTIQSADGSFGEGKVVSLPADEVARLQELGFLVKADAAPVAFGNGPSFTASDGPKIQVAE